MSKEDKVTDGYRVEGANVEEVGEGE